VTCTTSAERTILRGSTEYLKVELTADVTLDAQAVEFSLDDQATWLPAEAVGSTGTTRVYRHLLTPEEQPGGFTVEVLVRITDTPEVPVINAGTLTIAS
jgi:hypothetical protein